MWARRLRVIGWIFVAVGITVPIRASGQFGCPGDCDGDGQVTINELIDGVDIALGSPGLTACPAFDTNDRDGVTIDELIDALNHALTACPLPTPTATLRGPTLTATPSGPTPTMTPNALTLAPIGNRTVALGSTLTLGLSAFDPQGRRLAFSAAPVPLPANAGLDGMTGVFTFAPGIEQVGVLTLTFSVAAGESSVSETVTITVTGALPGGETALSGRILDTSDFVRHVTTPVVGATVSIRGTAISSVSDASGRFTLRGMRAGAQVFDINTATANPAPDASPYAGFHQGIDLIEGVVNVVERSFFLPRIARESLTVVDPAVTTTVTNPTLGVSLVIPPGTARADDGLPFDGSLSISGVPEGLAPEALPEGVDPGMLITIQPLGVTFDTPVPISFPNTDGLRAGSEVDLWSLNPVTGQFLVVGTGRVSGDGSRIDTIAGGVRAADWHFFLPLQALVDAIANLFNPSGDKCHTGSETAVSSGELTEEHILASYRSYDTARALRFVYGSLRADPQPIISTSMTVPVRAAVPRRISARLSVGGIDQGQPVFTDTAGLSEDKDETIRQVLQFDASALPTGLYPYQLSLTSHYAMSTVASTVTDQVVIQNERDSAFGAGWTLAELQRLYQPSADERLLVAGDGTTTRFQSPLNKWRKRPPLPAHPPLSGARGALAAAVLSDGIHVIAGSADIGAHAGQQYIAHDLYDPKTNSWAARAPMPDGLSWGAALAVVEGKLYLIGGSQGYLIREYDPAQDTWRYRAQIPGDGYHDGHAAAVVGGRIYVISGNVGYPVRSYEPASDTWSSGYPQIPIQRGALAAGVIGGEIFVVGTGTELQIYDPAANTWRQGAALPSATTAPSAAVFDGKLYVLGGSTNIVSAGGDLNAVQIYDPASDTWTTGPPMPTSRAYSAAALSAGKLYVFGGFDVSNNSTAATEELTLAFDGPPAFPGPPGDFSTLLFNADGTATRAFPNGTHVNFDAGGRETSVVERTGNTSSYAYDGSGRLSRVTDPAGLATAVNYTGERLFEVVDPAGRRTSFERDAAGNLARITDPDGSSRQFAYDHRHRLISQTSKRGVVTSYTYDFAGRNVLSALPDGSTRQVDPSETIGLADPMTNIGTEAHPLPVVRPEQLESTFTDGNGNTTRLATDGFGNGTLSVDPLGQTTRTTRNDEGLPVDVTRADGTRTAATYDGRGNRVTVSQAVGNPEERLASTAYEAAFSQPSSVTDASGNRTLLSYDAAGNLTRIVDGRGTETVFRYEDTHCAGLPTQATTAPGLPEENTAAFAHDPTSCNVVRVTDATGSVTTFHYDAAGYPIEVVDGNAGTTRFRRDALNRVTRTIDATNPAPDPSCGVTGVTCQTYDPQGNLASVTDGRGGVTSFEYDALERLLVRTDPLEHMDAVAYDAAGNPTSVTDRSGQMTRFGYDAVNQRVSEVPPAGPGTDATGLTYDAVGNLTAVTAPASTATTVYDRVDDQIATTLAGSSGPPQSRIDYTRTKTGLRATLSVATGDNPVQSVTYGYDGVNNLTALGAEGPATFAYEYHYDAAGRPTARLPMGAGPGVTTSLQLDAGARPTRMTNASPDGSTVFTDFHYAYDAVGNVLTATDDAGATTYTYDALYRLTGANGPGIGETYSYDAVGNRLSKGGLSYTYDIASRLVSATDGTTYTYDANGNLRTMTAGGGTTTYTWNTRNQLIRIDFPGGTNAVYTYDALGRRLSKRDRAGTLRYYVYDGADLVQELDATGTVLASYVYEGLDQPLTMTRGGVTYYYVYDRLGSVGLTNGAGEAVVRYRYDPWGNLLASEGSNPGLENPFRFTGREWDAESGIYYYRMRYYDPTVGRFISQDPLATPGSSRYVYTSNNPVNAIDPTGLLEESLRRLLQVGSGIVAGIGAGVLVVAASPGILATLGGVAIASGVAAAGGAVGGLISGAAIERLTSTSTECGGDRNIWEGAKAGLKGGIFAGLLTPMILAVNPALVDALEASKASDLGGAIGGFAKGLLDPRSVMAGLRTMTPAQQALTVSGYGLGLAFPVGLGTTWVITKLDDLVHHR